MSVIALSQLVDLSMRVCCGKVRLRYAGRLQKSAPCRVHVVRRPTLDFMDRLGHHFRQ